MEYGSPDNPDHPMKDHAAYALDDPSVIGGRVGRSCMAEWLSIGFIIRIEPKGSLSADG